MLRLVTVGSLCVLILLINISRHYPQPLLLHKSAPAKRPLRFGNINFLHTTDTHGWLSGHLNQPSYDADWGDFVSFAQHMKASAHARGQDLLLVDSGDRHDGNGLSDTTVPNGARAVPIFVKQQYDIITLGNHELYSWDNSEQEAELLVPHYGENYVCSNVEYLGPHGKYVPFGQKYRYFSTEKQGLRVLAFSFLFDFDRNNNRTRVTPIEQAVEQDWFQDVLASHPEQEVDMIVVVGHVPVTKRWTELQMLHSALRSRYPDTLIQYFGGHSHIRDFSVFDDKSTGLQSGRFCETLGFLSVNTSSTVSDIKDRFFRSYIDFSTDSFMHHSHKADRAEFITKQGMSTKALLAAARKELQLDKELGQVSQSNYFMDYVPLTHPKNLYHLLTSRVLPTLTPQHANTSVHDQRLILINTGSVRYDLYKGPYTVDSHFIVSPFQNDWMKVSLPRNLALKIAPKLNENGYILSSETGSRMVSNSYLRPPHQRYLQTQSTKQETNQMPMDYPDLDGEVDLDGKLTKGYVTHDDFGNSGDDTPHRGVKHFPLPNVVQSTELRPGHNEVIDVVFYSFLIPNVKWAIEKLGGQVPEIEFYSDVYLGQLLDQFVAANEL